MRVACVLNVPFDWDYLRVDPDFAPEFFIFVTEGDVKLVYGRDILVDDV